MFVNLSGNFLDNFKDGYIYIYIRMDIFSHIIGTFSPYVFVILLKIDLSLTSDTISVMTYFPCTHLR